MDRWRCRRHRPHRVWGQRRVDRDPGRGGFEGDIDGDAHHVADTPDSHVDFRPHTGLVHDDDRGVIVQRGQDARRSEDDIADEDHKRYDERSDDHHCPDDDHCPDEDHCPDDDHHCPESPLTSQSRE